MATGKKRTFVDAEGNQTLQGSVVKAVVGSDNRTTITGYPSDFTNDQFLGASIISFTCRVGWGAESSELSVELVEDDCRAEKFLPPAIGSPVNFKYSSFEFGGLLTNWEARTDTSGRKISATVRSPSVVLSNSQIILKGADDFEPAGNMISVSGGDSFCREVSIGWTALKAKIQTATFTYKGNDFTVDCSDIPGDIPFDGDSISVLEAINRAASAQSLQIYLDFITGDKNFVVELPDGSTHVVAAGSNFIKVRTHDASQNLTFATAINDTAGSNAGSSGFARATKGSVLSAQGLLAFIPGASIDSNGVITQNCSVVVENDSGQVISESFYPPNSLTSFSAGIESADVCTHAVINGGPVEAIWRIQDGDTYDPEINFETAQITDSKIYHFWGNDPDTNGILISEIKPDTKIEVGIQKQIFHELLEVDTYTIDLFEMRVASQGYEVWYDWMANTCDNSIAVDANDPDALGGGWEEDVIEVDGKDKTVEVCNIPGGKAKILSKFTGLPTYAQSTYVNRAIKAVLKANMPAVDADPDGGGIANMQETFASKKKEMEENGNLKKLKALHSFVSSFAAKYGQEYFVRFPDDLFFCCTTDLEGVLTDNPGPGNWEKTASGWHPQSDATDDSGNSNAFVLNQKLKWGGAALSNFIDEQGKCKSILEFDYNPEPGKTALLDPLTEQEVELDFQKISGATQFHDLDSKKVFLEASFDRVYRSCDANAFAETVGEEQVKISGATLKISGGIQAKIKEDPSKQVVGLSDATLAVTYNNRVASDDQIKPGKYVTPVDEDGEPMEAESLYKRFQDLVRRHGSNLKGNKLGPFFISPISAAVPLKSNQLRYGPKEYTSSADGASPTDGRSEYESNTSLVPWEFGSITAMNAAFDLTGQTKVSSQTLLESGSVKFTGTPAQIGIYRLGDALISGGPNITGVSINVGMGGITTDVTFRTYTRSFGELAQNKINMLSRMGQAQQGLQKAFNTKIAERYALGVSRKLEEMENAKDKKEEDEESKKKNSPKSNTSIVTQNHRIDSKPVEETSDGFSSSGSSVSKSNFRFNTSVSIETTHETVENLNSSSSTTGATDGSEEKKRDYKRKASCSLDNFFRPYMIGSDTGGQFLMPTMVSAAIQTVEQGSFDCVGEHDVGYGETASFNNGIVYYADKGCCSVVNLFDENGDDAGIQPKDGATVHYKIDASAMNPFMSKEAAGSAGLINFGTAPVKRVTRGSSYPSQGLTAGEGNSIAEAPQEEQENEGLADVRSVGLSGPLMIVGWGYDIEGKPVPGKGRTDSEDQDDNGGSSDEEPSSQFVDDWINKPHLWKAGPLDIRWNEKKGMWVPNIPERPVGFIIEGKLKEDLAPGGTGEAVMENPPQGTATVSAAVVTNRLGQPLCKGQRIFAYYNPFSCEFVILQAEFIPVTVVTDMAAYEKEGENTKGCVDLVATTRIIYVQSPPTIAVQTRWAQVRGCDSCPVEDNSNCREGIEEIVREMLDARESDGQNGGQDNNEGDTEGGDE